VTLSNVLSQSGQRAPTGQAPAAEGLTREILALAAVVVLGSVMTILDATIVNVAPVGLVAIALAVRLLPAGGRRSTQRLDVPGAVLLSGGLALFLYGLAEIGQHARLVAPAALGPMAAGARGAGAVRLARARRPE